MDGHAVIYFDVGTGIVNDAGIKEFEVPILSNFYAGFGEEIVSEIVIMHEQYSSANGSEKRENLFF